MHSVADALFALPRKPRTANVVGALSGWSDALQGMGVEVGSAGGGQSADLVVVAADRVAEAVAGAPSSVVVVGPGAGGGLRDHGYTVRRLLPFPGPERPDVLLPLSARRQLRYAFDRSPPDSARKRIRNRLAVAVLGAGLVPPGRPLVAVASREPGPPFMIAEAARRLELPTAPEWLLLPAGVDPLSRGTLQIFRPEGDAPEWVLKFARVAGYATSFDRDERGLRLAAQAGGVVAARAPRLLARFAVDGVEASVESAAVGRSLVGYLGSAAATSDKLAMIDRVAGWIVEVGKATASAPGELTAERSRLREEVLPRWESEGVSGTIVDEVPDVPGVLQHNDLGTWNITVDPRRDSFTALDWESSRAVGLPLWDLWYFLQDALGVLDGFSGLGEANLARREAHATRLFRGELPSSAVLFEWTRRAVDAFSVPRDSVGRLATLCFLHHGLSQDAREESVSQYASQAQTVEMPWPRLARAWITDPELGSDWRRWDG
jgi:hypothetical protein